MKENNLLKTIAYIFFPILVAMLYLSFNINSGLLLLTIPICSVLVVLTGAYLLISAGHVKGKEGITLIDVDKIPIEILIILFIAIIYFSILLGSYADYLSNRNSTISVGIIITIFILIYTVLAITATSVARRIKAKVFWKSTLIGMFTMAMDKGVRKLNAVNIPIKTVWKVILSIGIYIATMLFLPKFFGEFLGNFLDIIITVCVFVKIVKVVNSFEKIEEHLKKMYDGNINEKLDEDKLSKEFKSLAEYINGISNGFENAVQEGIKSERLKAELITNVSHDIKTPLTSIINYVDLLKKENIKNKKAKEYIDILDTKSQRLKRLTEDLVEASKASSGNVKLTLEKINVGELINQTTGEFEDKFKEKKLEIITQIPEEEILIEADSRYMYRVIENLFSNISKYALEASRVYVDVLSDKGKVKILIKNISKEKLNISAEELMQRFVRGDKSRTTEGSGLGLSISQSLTELQKGKFSIQIDGDLFKVELEFERI